jgi:dihydrodipicolinate synthase/N-acetylneuraminate lyase
MTKKPFQGTGTAMITPFKGDGTVDEKALRRAKALLSIGMKPIASSKL